MTQNTPSKSARGGYTAGAVLILIGLMSLLQNTFQPLAWLFMAILAVVFMVTGLYFRKAGLIIPGGVLSGISAGIFLVTGPYQTITETTRGGIFLLSMAGGFILVALLSWVLARLNQESSKWMVWPFIPAGFLALIGGLLALGNLRAVELIGQGWPIGMIAIGLYMVLRRRELQS